ncbi:hypothetical protein DAPPUDRAFT_251771 [Daphnia pulex]|nr:hypothetical protein DAPPUDRAFT_251771 [Daphnia pulex]|eukprot:EFX74562.1 hypothetical protein DAPPUDRAFT_251771 [Daphnia pulex]
MTIEGHGDHYTHPRQSLLQKERPVCFSIEGHGDHYVKRVMQWCRVDYGIVLLLGVVSLMSTTRENLLKGKIKGNRSQSSEHLRPGNNCILRRITRSQSRLTMPSCCYWLLYRRWLGRPLVYRRILVKADTKPQRHRLTTQKHTQRPDTTPSYTTKALEYYTEAPTETTQLRMLPKPTTSRLQLITSPKLSNSTLERPSTTEISQVSFSDTQHGNPEVSNKLRFKQWNGKE